VNLSPLLDINYGLGDRIQLKYQVPYLLDSDNGAIDYPSCSRNTRMSLDSD
jgi:hypothetical protein